METETRIQRLKREAKELGIQHSPNIGPDTLDAKIKAHKAQVQQEEQTPMDTREAKIKSATKLHRVIVTCMNQSKMQGERQGEIFMVSNSTIGTLKKFIPYGHKVHVEAALLNVIKERKFQQRTGPGLTESREIREFSIEYLPDLSPQEAAELKKLQALRAEADGHRA